MGNDIRVILIKIADRLHNMITLSYLKRDRQIANAKETLDLYAPLANRLGLYSIKAELEDLGFKYLYPDTHSHPPSLVPIRFVGCSMSSFPLSSIRSP